MASSFYRQAISIDAIEESPKVTPMSQEEIEETKKRLIEYAEKTLPVFEANHRYLRENYAELLKEYPDQWIAVHELRVVASDSTITGLFDKVDQLSIRRGDIVGEFLATNPKPLIL